MIFVAIILLCAFAAGDMLRIDKSGSAMFLYIGYSFLLLAVLK